MYEIKSRRVSSQILTCLIFPIGFVKKATLLRLPPEVFCKKRCSQKFRKFIGKHLCQSLFFIKVAGLRLSFFTEHFWTTDSDSSEKNVIVEEEIDCIDIDDIGNLKDSPRLVFFDEECENPIVVNDGGELTENVSQKKRYTTAYRCPLNDKCCRREYFLSNLQFLFREIVR